jgi:hypothetical protein
MSENVDHQARNHGWARCLGEGCPLCAVGVPPRLREELECREVEIPSYPWPDGSAPTTAMSHAFASGAPGTRCQCGLAEVGPDRLARPIQSGVLAPTGEYLESTDADGNVRRYPIMTFAEALAARPRGAVGAHEATDEAHCQTYHGMSRAEWDAAPEPTPDLGD